ncbi:unnamed protein product [Mucor fragilis]
MSETLDISNAKYYMVIILLNGRIFFTPCNILTTASFITSMQSAACLQIKDSCITNGDRDEILSIGDHRIEDYVNRTGNKDCVLVDDLIKKMFQASTNKQSQADTDLTQLFMSFAIIQAIKNSGTHQDVNEQALKLWIYVIVTPIEWGKGVTSDALFSVFSGSRFITPSNALVMAAFDTLLRPYLQMESFAERNTLPNSKNILCELSVKKTGDASLSMDIFSKFEGDYQEQGSTRLDHVYPFQTCKFTPTIEERDISALRLINLADIYAAVFSQRGEVILSDIRSLIEKEVCITRIFFIVVPEVPYLYPDFIEDILFVSIVLMKLQLEASSIKKFKYIYDRIRRIHSGTTLPYKPIDEYLMRMVAGASLKLGERLRKQCQESLPLSSLAHTVNDTSNIDTINYVCK